MIWGVISGFLHAIWNILAKSSVDKRSFLFSTQVASLLVFLPIMIFQWDRVHWSGKAIALVVASMVFHGIYFLLLSRAYSIGDLSQVYPIVRGGGALLVPAFGIIVLGERLNGIGIVGIVTIVVGLFALSEFHKTASQPVLLAILIAICVSIYVLVDRMALNYFPTISLVGWSTLGNVLALILAVRRHQIVEELKRNWKQTLVGTVLAPSSYLIFLLASRFVQVSQLAPIREIGTVFGVGMGILFLNEVRAKSRIRASVVITTGVVLLGWNPGHLQLPAVLHRTQPPLVYIKTKSLIPIKKYSAHAREPLL